MKSFARRFFLLLLVAIPTSTWAQFGGGLSYIHESGNNGLNGFSPSVPHWLARANLDLLRSHFVAGGQSHLRFRLGIVRVF